MKPRMTVDPRLLKLLGDKLYSSHPLPIVVRELLQNARDACIRKGVSPNIEITITVKEINDTIVICKDNGIGMTQEEMLNDFLCLGNSSKSSDSEAVGGFGVAKAALMRNDWWSVESLNTYMDSTFFTEDKDFQELKTPIDGTIVTVRITSDTYESTFRDALRFIDLSDVSVVLNATYKAREPISRYAGRTVDLSPYVGPNDEKFKIYGFLPTEDYESLTVVRSHGLVQFVNREWGRKVNFMVDFAPTERPEDPEYPFNMSREELISKYRRELAEFTSSKLTDPVTDEMNILREQQGHEVARAIVGDTLLRGGRTRMNTSDRAEEVMFQLEFRPGHMSDPDSIKVTSSDGMKVFLENYFPSEQDIQRDTFILEAWASILQITAHREEEFGVGLTTDPMMQATRNYLKGEIYYIINPIAFRQSTNKEALITKMYTLAVHECAHYACSSHNEYFTIEESLIFNETIEKFLEAKRKIMERL